MNYLQLMLACLSLISTVYSQSSRLVLQGYIIMNHYLFIWLEKFSFLTLDANTCLNVFHAFRSRYLELVEIVGLYDTLKCLPSL